MTQQLNLGTGLTFPFTFGNGTIDTETGLDHLKTKLVSVLSTPKGSCFFQRDKGWASDKLITHVNNAVLEELIYKELIEEIPAQIPELDVSDIWFSNQDSVSITINIDCISKQTLEPFTFVYPYFRQI